MYTSNMITVGKVLPSRIEYDGDDHRRVLNTIKWVLNTIRVSFTQRSLFYMGFASSFYRSLYTGKILYNSAI